MSSGRLAHPRPRSSECQIDPRQLGRPDLVLILLSITTLAACGSESTPAPQVMAAPAPSPTTAPEPPKSESLARADALVAEMRAHEASQAKYDRENPPPPPPRLEDLIRPTSSAPAPAPNAAPSTAAPSESATPSASSADPKATEAWWKDQARTLQVKYDDDFALMNQARNAMLNSTLKVTADEAEREYRARLAAVQNSRAALDRLLDDARRAGVPPGWTRWP